MSRTKTRALANWPNNAVSVLDYGPVIDVITERPTSNNLYSAGAGSLMINENTGQLLTKTENRDSSVFLNLTALAWAHVNGSNSIGNDLGFRQQNNFSRWDKTDGGTYKFYLSDNLTFSNNNDVLILASQPSGPAYCSNAILDGNGNASFDVTTFGTTGNSSDPVYLRVFVFGRPL